MMANFSFLDEQTYLYKLLLQSFSFLHTKCHFTAWFLLDHNTFNPWCVERIPDVKWYQGVRFILVKSLLHHSQVIPKAVISVFDDKALECVQMLFYCMLSHPVNHSLFTQPQ